MLHLLWTMVVGSLVAVWSFFVWVLHSLAAWTLNGAGALTGAARGLEMPAWPGWMEAWVPPGLQETVAAAITDLGPWLEGLVGSAPSAATGLAAAAWVIWGLGAGVLVLAGVVGHLLIVAWRRRAGGGGPDGARTLATG